ncbi:MAG TPA: FmdB family zinc ribbon protein [Actinomycetota bacterium]|nr:FmdB family zinc ribbon protein [Actinomycetota bacterium]
MPTYEYECTACGQHIEVFQRFSEDPLTTCGVCGGPLRKVFHPAGIVFKGSGFYATDSRSKKPSTTSSKKDGDAGSGSAGSDGKSSSKPSSTGAPSSGEGGSTSKASTASEAS